MTVFQWRSGKRPSKVELDEQDFGSCNDEDESAKDVNNGEEVCGIYADSESTFDNDNIDNYLSELGWLSSEPMLTTNPTQFTQVIINIV